MSSNAIQTSFFFRGMLAGYIEVFPRRNATAAICNLDGNAMMNTVNCITTASSVGRQCRKAA